MCTSGKFRSGPRKIALLKYFKHIEPSKEERIQGVLPKPDGLGMSNAELRDSLLYNHLLLNAQYTGVTPTFYIKALCLVTNVQQL